MHTQQAITKKLNVPADKAWQAIRAIGRLDVWFPIIATCEVDGQGTGAHRHMTLVQGGGKMTDRIDEISDTEQRLVYRRTELPFPVTNYQGTVEIFRSYDAQAVVVWTVHFDAAPEDIPALTELVNTAISDGINGLERDLQNR